MNLEFRRFLGNPGFVAAWYGFGVAAADVRDWIKPIADIGSAGRTRRFLTTAFGDGPGLPSTVSDPANGLDGADLAGKNTSMKFVVRAFQVGFVWLTAVTTLVASVPHFDCFCPNGTHELFCLGISSARTGCCCGGSCCSSSSGGKCCGQSPDSSADKQVEQSCCCGSQRQPIRGTPRAGIQVKGRCCQKTAVAGKFVGVSPPKEGAKQNLTYGFSAPLPQLGLPATERTAGHRPWLRYALPPPTDLVITLQHFLI